MSLTRQQYDRLRDLRGELEDAAQAVAEARPAKYVPSGRNLPSTHVCLTCMRQTGVPEWHRGHRLVSR